MRKIFCLLMVAVLAGGCAIGNTHRYDLGDAALSLESDKTVAVATLDLRPYVRSGDKPPRFVGLQRGGFGNPFDVNTTSGRALADDMTISIVNSLKNAKVRATAVTLPPSAGRTAARETLLKAGADRFVLFAVREWKTDTYMNTAVIHDATLTVLGRGGTTMAEKTLKGRADLGTSFLPADARKGAERTFRQKLEEAFNDPKVAAALK